MIPIPNPTLAVHGAANTHVAPLLPATAAAPEPARKINFFKALLLYWLLPKRYGPHLAVGSWTRALLAHVLSVLATGMAALGVFISQNNVRGGLHGLREQAAEFVIETAARSASGTGGSGSWIPAVMTILFLPLAELSLILLAILIMPWYAGGDRAGSVFKRSLKSLYWSTTLLIPLAVLAAALALHPFNLGKWIDRHSDLLSAGVIIAGVGIPLVLLARMLLAGGTRYVGQPDGPAFAPREPHCEDCGYLVVGLPLDARCPECGLQVAESLPGGRRHPTVWQHNELKASGFADLLRLQWVVITRKDFFRELPVHTGLPAARHFWWGTWCLMLLATLIGLKIVELAGSGSYTTLALELSATVGILVVPLALQSLMMFAVCLFGQVRYGIRDYRNSAVAGYYASPMMWPVPLLMVLALLPGSPPVFMWLIKNQYMNWLYPLWGINGCGVYQMLVGLVFLAVMFFWWGRLCRALHDIQHANV